MTAVAVLTEEQLEQLLVRAVERALASRGGAAPVLSTEQAAKVAGVTAKTVRGWIAAGLLPAGRRGTRRTVLRADLDRYLAGERGSSARSPAELAAGHARGAD